MAKCRLLYQENEELGKVINSGRVAKLESELALQKNFGEEVKKSQLGKTNKVNIFIGIYTQILCVYILYKYNILYTYFYFYLT